MVIYADVLVALNLFVNYFLLLAAKKMLRYEARTQNIVLSSLVGGLYSLTVYLQGVPKLLQILMNISVLTLMTVICFRPKSFKLFLKELLCFIGVNTAFAGIMLAVWLFFTPEGMFYNNSIVYFDIDIKLLVISTLACYLILRLIFMFAKRSAPEDKVISVTLIKNGRAVSVNALLDTGNTLKDAFTGNEVAVADEAVIRNLLGFSLDTYISREKAGLYNSERLNIRLIPVTTVSSEALLPAVKVDEIILNNTNTAVKNLLVAQSKSKIKNGEYQLILSSEIVNEVENNVKRTTEKTAFKN